MRYMFATILCVLDSHKVFIVRSLTHVVGDNGEGFQIGLPDVLCQRVGVVFEVAEQMCRAALCPLDLLPMLLGVRIQYGAACSHQILEQMNK